MKKMPKKTATQKRPRETIERPTAPVDFALRALSDTTGRRDYEREFLEEISKGHIEAERIARITREFTRGFRELLGIGPSSPEEAVEFIVASVGDPRGKK